MSYIRVIIRYIMEVELQFSACAKAPVSFVHVRIFGITRRPRGHKYTEFYGRSTDHSTCSTSSEWCESVSESEQRSRCEMGSKSKDKKTKDKVSGPAPALPALDLLVHASSRLRGCEGFGTA